MAGVRILRAFPGLWGSHLRVRFGNEGFARMQTRRTRPVALLLTQRTARRAAPSGRHVLFVLLCV